MSQPLEKKPCDHTPTSISVSDSGSSTQFPNSNGEPSITEPSSLSKERIVLNHTYMDLFPKPQDIA